MRNTQADHESNLSSKYILPLLLALGLALVIWCCLVWVGSPKARFNVLQVVCWLFLVGLVCRQTISGLSSQQNPSETFGGYTNLLTPMILGSAVYATVLGFYFVSDDFAHLKWAQDPPLQLLWEQLTEGQSGTFYRPLGFASLLLDYHIWHDWPPGYHLTNLLLHLGVTSGTFFLCREVGLDSRSAGKVALVFSVLPILAETVTWISARFDLLSACFTIWALVFYVRARTRAGRPYDFWTVVFCILALLSKESAYALPALAISVEILFLKPIRFQLPLVLAFTSCLMFALRCVVLGGIGGYEDLTTGQPAFLSFGKETVEGLLIRTPTQLLFGFNWSHNGLLPTMLYPALLGGALLALCLTAKGRQHRMVIWFSIGWIVLAALPAHSLLLVSTGLAGSRVYYLPAVGAALLVGLLLSSLESPRVRRLWTTGIVLLMGLGLLHNLGAWRHASDFSQRSLLELKSLVPSPQVNSRFLFLNMPDRIDGVYFFVNGLSQGVQMTFGRRDLDGTRDLGSDFGTGLGLGGRQLIKVRWVGDDRQLLVVE